METLLYIVHILVCISMLPIILLQSGKGGGVSATFGGGSAGTVFGSRGASTFLQRLTSIAAVVFMFTSITLSWYASQSRSVLGSDTSSSPSTSGSGADQSKAPDNPNSTNQVPMPTASSSSASGTTE